MFRDVIDCYGRKLKTNQSAKQTARRSERKPGPVLDMAYITPAAGCQSFAGPYHSQGEVNFRAFVIALQILTRKSQAVSLTALPGIVPESWVAGSCADRAWSSEI